MTLINIDEVSIADIDMKRVCYDGFRIDYGAEYGGAIYTSVIYDIGEELIAIHYTIRIRNNEYYIDKISTSEVFKESGIYLYGNPIDDDACGIQEDIEHFESILLKKKMPLST